MRFKEWGLFSYSHTHIHTHIRRHSELRARNDYWKIHHPFACVENRPPLFPVSNLFTSTSVTRCTVHPFLATGQNSIRHEPSWFFLRDRGGRFISANTYDITIRIFQAHSTILHSKPSVIHTHLRQRSYDSGEWGDVQGWGICGVISREVLRGDL